MFVYLLIFFAVLICCYTVSNTLYLAIFALAGRFYKVSNSIVIQPTAMYRRIAVLVPAYREDYVIIESVRANLKQTYPEEFYDLVVIADSFLPTTLNQLIRMPIRVVEVSFEVSTVAKALKAGFQALDVNAYDIVVVADADNHMAPDFLERINVAFEQGWKAVQGHRIAKNKNTTVAILDAISEEINNHIFRKGHQALGISPSFIGSGMALEYSLMKQYIQQTTDISGYDKGLDMYVREHGIRIRYLEHAMIYDEKVQTGPVFEHQRTRWMQAHLYYLRKYFVKGIVALRHGRLDYAEKAFQLFVLPRILLLGTLIISLLVGLTFDVQWLIWVMGIQLGILIVILVIATPNYLIRLVKLNEMAALPGLFVRFVRSTLNVRRARNRFLHTPHGIHETSVGGAVSIKKEIH